MLVSFSCSALWHGIYPSYFAGFLHWALLNEVSRFCFKASHLARSVEKNPVYRVVVWILTNTILNYVGIMIVVLGTHNLLDYLNNLYWSGSLVIVGLYVFFSLNPQLMSKKEPKTQ